MQVSIDFVIVVPSVLWTVQNMLFNKLILYLEWGQALMTSNADHADLSESKAQHAT